MCSGECFARLNDDGKNVFQLQIAADKFAQSFAFDVFGGDIIDVFKTADIVNRKNIRMIQSRNRPRFELKSFDSFIVESVFRRQNFERDLAAQFFVIR